jgi:hypothetical protein
MLETRTPLEIALDEIIKQLKDLNKRMESCERAFWAIQKSMKHG